MTDIADLFADTDSDGSDAPAVTRFTRSGKRMEAPSAGRDKSGLVGLRNQGATCYLNSLLQALFITPELRGALYSLDPEKVLGAKKYEEYEALLEQEEEYEEAVKAEVKAAAAAADGDGTAVDGAAAPEPMDFDKMKRKLRKQCRIIPLELQRLFTQLHCLDKLAVTTDKLTERGFQWHNAEGRTQHDVQELNKKLYEAIENGLKRIDQAQDLVEKLYRVNTTQGVLCLNCNRASMRDTPPDFDILVPVKGKADLAQSLLDYVEKEKLEGGNKYYCSNCDAKHNARLGTTITKLPPLLVISLLRFDFDYTKLERVKVNSRFEIPLVLDMRPFVKGGKYAEVVVDVGEESKTCSERMKAAHADARAGMVWLSDLDTKEGRERATAVSRSLDGAENVYDLYGIIIHRGTAFQGHYFAYLRDTQGLGNWTPSVSTRKKKKPPAASRPGGASTEDPVDIIVRALAQQPVDSRMKMHTCEFGRIGSLVKQETGYSWNQRYRDDWGKLKTFLNSHSESFKVEGQMCYLLPAALERLGLGSGGADAAAAAAVESADTSGGARPGESDLEYALRISQEAAGGGAGGAGAGAADEGWTTVGGGGASAAALAAPPAELAGDALQQALADEWGHWFTFDDSKVYAMNIGDLDASFQGSDCAYMCMYRARSMGRSTTTDGGDEAKSSADATPPAGEDDGAGAGDAPPPPPLKRQTTNDLATIPPPEYWKNQVESANKSMAESRDTFDKATHQLSFTVHSPGMYKRKDCYLVKQAAPATTAPAGDAEATGAGAGAGAGGAGAGAGAGADADTDAGAVVAADEGGIEITVDDRITVAQLKMMIVSTHRPFLADELVPTEASKLQLTVVRPCEPGHHLYDHVGHDVTEPVSGAGDDSFADAWALNDSRVNLSQGVSVLAWDGLTIDGAPVATGFDNEPVLMNLRYLRKGKPITEMELILPKPTHLGTLLKHVHRLCELPTKHVGLHVIGEDNRHRPKMVKLVSKASKDGSAALLHDYGIRTGCELFVEDMRQVGRGARPLAVAELKRREKMVELTVVNVAVTGGDAPDELTMMVERSATLAEVKMLVHSKLGAIASTVEGGGRFRRFGPRDQPGALFDREDDTVSALHMNNGSRFLFEAGAPLAPDQWQLFFRIVTGNDQTPLGGGKNMKKSDLFEMFVDSRTTGEQLKQLACAQAGLPPKEARMRRIRTTTAVFQEASGLVRNEENYISKDLSNGCEFWVEEGTVPRKGMCEIRWSVWTPELARKVKVPEDIIPGLKRSLREAAAADAEAGTGLLASITAGISSLTAGVSGFLGGDEGEAATGGDSAAAGAGAGADGTDGATETKAEPDMDAYDYIMDMKAACLTAVPELKMMRTQTVLELKMHMLAQPSLSCARALAEAGVAPKGVVTGLDESGEAKVPTLMDLGLTPNHLRIMELSHRVPGKLLKRNATRLTKIGGKNKSYVVEVLKTPEELDAATLVLFVQRRIPHIAAQRKAFAPRPVPPPEEAKAKGTAAGDKKAGDGTPAAKPGKAAKVKMASPSLEDFAVETTGKELADMCGINTPTWPPMRVVFKYGKRPDTAQLHRCLSKATGIPVPRIRCAKLFSAKNRLGGGMWRVVTDSRPVPKSRRARKKMRNAGPPNLKEAPFLFKDGDVIAVADSADDPHGEDNWLRAEDYRRIARNKIAMEFIRAERAAQREAARSGGSVSVAKRSNRPEVPFRIYMDDYSDDEGDDGSSGGEDEAKSAPAAPTAAAPSPEPRAAPTPPASLPASGSSGSSGSADYSAQMTTLRGMFGGARSDDQLLDALKRYDGDVERATDYLFQHEG